MTDAGLYYKPADLYIDPSRAVSKAVITHAHADHARPGSSQYLCSLSGLGLVKARVYSEAVTGIKYGEKLRIGEANISFHPAGHILGSAQIRLEHKGHVTVVSGDYKIEPDSTSEGFEVVPCHHFISECTFGLPIYQWDPAEVVFKEINEWWKKNSEEGKTSILLAYALGKAQRLLAGVDSSIGPIGIHPLMNKFMPFYKAHLRLPSYRIINSEVASNLRSKALIICPASALQSPVIAKLAPFSIASASGWMLTAAARKKTGYDRGFALSDHADWTGLLTTIKNTKAEEVWTTHGYTTILAKHLRENGINASELEQQPIQPRTMP